MRITIVVGRKWHAPELAEALRSLGHEVSVVTTEPAAFGTLHAIRIRARSLLRLAGRYPTFAPSSHRYFTARARRVVSRLNPELVIAWSSFARELDLGAVPVIIVRGSHHIQTQARILSGSTALPRHRRRMIEREMAEYAKFNAVTVPTREIASDPAWGSTPLVVAGYGFPTFQEVAAPPLDATHTMLFVGELSLRKGIDRVARVARIMSGSKLVVVGRAPAGFAPDLPGEARLLGMLAHEEVLAVMRAAHVLILPSREEGQARVGLEAMSVGLPILVTPESGLKVWCDLGAGICLPGDSSDEEYRAALSAILQDHSRFSARAKELADSWSWRDHASELLTFVEQSQSQSRSQTISD